MHGCSMVNRSNLISDKRVREQVVSAKVSVKWDYIKKEDVV